MTCAICRNADAVDEPDARLPRLAVPSCWRCRDVIASDVGWSPAGGRRRNATVRMRPRMWIRGVGKVTVG